MPIHVPKTLTANMDTTEEEKKSIAPLLGKLFISPTSSEEKIREVYAEVCEAVEGALLTDATGRNALYKIHVSLGKIVNTLDQQQEAGLMRRTASRSVSLAPDNDQTVMEDKTVVKPKEPRIKEEDEDEDMDVDDDTPTGIAGNDVTVIHTTEKVEEDDSIVDDLLSDDDGDTVMS